ncbi:Periplasmic protease [Ignavibacterium album JCM 16511]|uniref:Periplasmic protease n=1 Tax=Ignavibacterium album (strain DSM 19864 / JCM 16511 / NBRC 101810 / Mat9-16) TaxID=945713 RepID=I0AJD7_IGNAJ|nr:S41 family peptidase [Ignavibacterium album]AFH49094.1 Periplasmic protease [Ignavibacterium album JCM 16511]
MKKTVFILVLLSALIVGFYIQRSGDIYYEISKNMELFGKVYKEISFNYVDEINPEEFMREGIKGMLKSLDPYTVFIDESKQEDIDLMTNGKYGGIGVTIGVRNDRVTITEILEGYAAQKQGLRIGDVVIEVDGEPITSSDIDNLSAKVKGEPGTTVQLRVLRNNDKDTLQFNIVREEIIIRNLVYAGFYPANSNNVYLKLSNFSRSAAEEIKNALKKLKEEKPIESIVLDLRGNPGGLLDVAVDVCNKFLKKDLLIVSTKGRDPGSEKKYFAKEEPIVPNEKLIVLINENSASASEIVAGAIQDHDRGIILGTQSFGKGLVQTITPISYNTSLKITTAKYYTPSGRCIQKIDYSKKNKVFSSPLIDDKSEFTTDNNRKVYSAGGITPDTLVKFEIEGEITKELLAKGIIFDFADKFYYQNQSAKFENLNDSRIFNEFISYIKSKEFNYTPEVEKKLNSLMEDLEKNKINGKILSAANKLKDELKNYFEKELDKYKSEILSYIKIELANRYYNQQKGLEESLKYDKQFNTAITLFKNESVFNKLLNKGL